MCKMLDQYADKIKGIFSFFDRMIINGYILPLTSEHSRPGALSQLNVLYKDFKTYFLDITESIKSRIEDSASELGRPVIYIPSAKQGKEDKFLRYLP